MPYKFTPKKPFHLYHEDKGRFNKDAEFLDGIAREQINYGGVLVHVFRLKGTFDQNRDELGIRTDPGIMEATDIGSFLGIQDTILGENRDREYDWDDIPRIRGIYQVSQNDLEYARFGLAGLTNNIITMEFHIRETEELLGRRFIPGDVVEMPHLREVGIDGRVANRWYEVASVVKSPQGWDPTYAFHVLGVILRPLRDAQEFIDIFEREDEYGKTIRDQTSNRAALLDITANNQSIAEAQAPTTWWDNTRLYIDPEDKTLRPEWTTDDARPPNAIPVDAGPSFPAEPVEFQYFVRNNVVPNRLYQFYDTRWHIKEIDRKREWQPYTWVRRLREFISDRSETDKARKYELKSVHDIATSRQKNSDPSPNQET